jgi:hypothetical protein
MKKFVFLTLCLLALAALVKSAWVWAAFFALALAGYVAWEHARRIRPRFLAGNASATAFSEQAFPMNGHLFALAASPEGGKVLVVGLDGHARLLDAGGVQIQDTRLGQKPLGLLLAESGRLYLALEREVVGVDAQGKVFGRLGFEPPEQGAQAYKLHLSADGGTLLLHTPWFVQWLDPDLGALGPRLTSQQAGNYIKYLELAPDGSFVFLGGALMLEEGAGVQARWARWSRNGSELKLEWQKEDESQDNTHLRALGMSRDGSCMFALVHRAGYEFIVHDPQGNELWRRQGEDPVLSPDGSLMLWHNAFEGLTLTELDGRKKLWSRKPEAKVRLKQVDPKGRSLILEGRHLLLFGRDGKMVSDDWFQTDPHDLSLSESGTLLACVRQLQGALIKVS